jgi:predicted secreted protein
MDSQELIQMMKSVGASDEVAEMRARDFIRQKEDNELFEKSLTALEDVALAQQEAEEAHQERLVKAFDDGQQSVAEAMAPALDSLLAEQRAQNEALCKGLTGALELIKSLKADVQALKGQNVVVEAPVMAKSVSYLPSPADNVNNESDLSRDELFKALGEISTNSPERAADLMKAAALLESGVNPNEIKSRFNI